MGEKLVKNDAGQLSLDDEAKKEAWREHYERLLNVEFPWNPLRTSSRRDAFQLTGRKASLSICTRAKGMLWIEATTGAWSWLSKWWRCWSVWWRDSSGKELRSMRCSVASCLAVALLMQFLLYVNYRRSTWLPTSRSTWPSSTWRKHLIEFHGVSSGGQCAN